MFFPHNSFIGYKVIERIIFSFFYNFVMLNVVLWINGGYVQYVGIGHVYSYTTQDSGVKWEKNIN